VSGNKPAASAATKSGASPSPDAAGDNAEQYESSIARSLSPEAEGQVHSTSEHKDAASHLYEIGTFAQVHTILTGDTADSAQLLLLGHRRIRRKSVVSPHPLSAFACTWWQ
jgi:hypothetical protein